MKVSAITSLLGLAAVATATQVLPRNYDANDYYVLHLERDASPDEVARSLGLAHAGPFGELKDHHLFVADKGEEDIVKRELVARRRRKRSLSGRDVLDGVKFSQKQVLRKPWEKRVLPRAAGPSRLETRQMVHQAALARQKFVAESLQINDPIFKDQWHLFNPVQVGHDVNVTDVWLQGVTGKNATVAIVDDGLDMYSDDLKDNYYAKGSYDFNDKTEEPKPRLSDDHHGTRCAGEVSAVRNNVCGVGVAYDSRIAGLRILSKVISDADEALAMNYDFQNNQIYSCSWGPPDDGISMDAPGVLIRRAMLNAVQNGRGGLGSIYVFASGNGAGNDDNCNFDGYTNSIYSITVGAVDRKGNHPYYSEKCSASLVVTYSSGEGDAIHTTDVGQNNCFDQHGGTSAAAPLAAGIFALALQVRPDLTWRDMQYIAMDTAVPVNTDMEGEWQTTTVGRKYSHTFAYGKIDSYGLVEAARTWKNVKPQAWFFSPWIHVNEAIPQGDLGLSVSFEVTPDMLADANLERLEHVTVSMNVEHTRRGDLSVDLVSPNKVVSHLAATRRRDNTHAGYDDWTFMSVVHWGEKGLGTWTIVIRDTEVNEHSGKFVDWHLKLWGESIDASKAKVLPMPTEEDDSDHAVIATTTLPATTTTLPPDTATKSELVTDPTDHPDRPVNSKPAEATSSSASASATAPADEADETDEADEAETTAPSTWLPSFLPTFGVSSATQVWIYGSLGLIVAFCGGLGVYFYMARRKRLRNGEAHADYEFELLDEEEAEGLTAGEKKLGGGGGGGGGVGVGAAGKKGSGRRTRGGELYDAFAGGSDDDEEEDEYRDRAYGDIMGEDGHGEEEPSEKDRRRRRGEGGGSDDSGESDHHVVGDSDEEDDEEEERPLRSTGR